MTQVCTKCKRHKAIELFRGRRRKRHKKYASCLDCRMESSRAYHDKLRERQLEIRLYIYQYLLDHPCACGESAPEALEFDHRRDKKFNISHAAKMGYSIHAVKKEIEKTVVMCSNCHKKKTAIEQHWYNNIKALLEARSKKS